MLTSLLNLRAPHGAKQRPETQRVVQNAPSIRARFSRSRRVARGVRYHTPHALFESIASVVDTAAGAAASIAAILSLSVFLDSKLDIREQRVSRVTNAKAADGTCFYISAPNDGKPAPCVVVLHQFFGLRQREIELCDELAREGFVAVAPDTFNGQSTGWCAPGTSPTEQRVPRAITLVWSAALRPGGTWGREALEATIREIESDPRVSQQHAPVIAGFCYGGGAALRFAATHPGEVSAVASFYGSPITDMGGLEGPVLGIYGTADTQFPKATVDKFEADLRAASISARIMRFKDQPHAFVTDLAAIKRGGAAGQAWNAFLLFLHETTARSAAPISDDPYNDGGSHGVPVATAFSGHKRAGYGHTGQIRSMGRTSRARW